MEDEDFLRQYRLSYDPPLTQSELAKRLNVCQQTVSNWERRRSFPRPAHLRSLAELLGMSVSEILKNSKIRDDWVAT